MFLMHDNNGCTLSPLFRIRKYFRRANHRRRIPRTGGTFVRIPTARCDRPMMCRRSSRDDAEQLIIIYTINHKFYELIFKATYENKTRIITIPTYLKLEYNAADRSCISCPFRDFYPLMTRTGWLHGKLMEVFGRNSPYHLDVRKND